jgi:hypothetical protein
MTQQTPKDISNAKQQTGKTNINIKQQTLNNNNKYGKQFASPADADFSEKLTTFQAPTGSLGLADKSALEVKGGVSLVLGMGPTAKPLTTNQISYACLTLHKPKPKKLTENRQRVNLDFRIDASTNFNKLVFSLTQKDSEFYSNLMDDWGSVSAYIDAFTLYKDLKGQGIKCWIGKGCIRQTYKKGKGLKSKMRAETTMVLWDTSGSVGGRCWLEQAVFDFEFDQLLDASAHYIAKAEPFEPQGVWDDTPWV